MDASHNQLEEGINRALVQLRTALTPVLGNLSILVEEGAEALGPRLDGALAAAEERLDDVEQATRSLREALGALRSPADHPAAD